MAVKSDLCAGTLALMVLKTLQTLGPLHGYGIARRIEQTSGNALLVNYGTLYPALLKLEQESYITSEWGLSDNNRKAKFYKLTRAGRKRIDREERECGKTTAILARFLVEGRVAREAAARGRAATPSFEATSRCMSPTTCAPGMSPTKHADRP